MVTSSKKNKVKNKIKIKKKDRRSYQCVALSQRNGQNHYIIAIKILLWAKSFTVTKTVEYNFNMTLISGANMLQ